MDFQDYDLEIQHKIINFLIALSKKEWTNQHKVTEEEFKEGKKEYRRKVKQYRRLIKLN